MTDDIVSPWSGARAGWAPGIRSAVLAAPFGLAALGPAAAQDTPITGEALLKLFNDTTVRTVAPSGARVAVYNAKDGTRSMYWQNQSRAGTDHGVCRRDGDRICSSVRNSRGGAETCFVVVKRGDSYVSIYTHDKSELPFTIEQGNTINN